MNLLRLGALRLLLFLGYVLYNSLIFIHVSLRSLIGLGLLLLGNKLLFSLFVQDELGTFAREVDGESRGERRVLVTDSVKSLSLVREEGKKQVRTPDP